MFSDLLVEGLTSPVPVPRAGQFVVPEAMAEALDDWMQVFVQQMQSIAPRYLPYLKKLTGRGFKLFRTFLTDNGKVVARFDPAKRGRLEFGPMVVFKVGYTPGLDLYDVGVEVWSADASTMLGSAQTDNVDVEMLADPERMLYRVEPALGKISLKKTADSVKENENMGYAHLLEDALLTEKGETPEQLARMQRNTEFAKRTTAIDDKKRGAAPEKKPEGGGIGGAIKKGMKMVFGRWVKVEGAEAEGPDVVELDEAAIGTSLPLEEVVLLSKEKQKKRDAMNRRLAKAGKPALDINSDDEDDDDDGPARPGMKMVFGKWVKTEDENLIGSPLDEALVLARNPAGTWSFKGRVPAELAWRRKDGEAMSKKDYADAASSNAPAMAGYKAAVFKSKEEAQAAAEKAGAKITQIAEANVTSRLGFGTEGGTFGSERTNPTKTGPAAERANTLRQAAYGIEKMIDALKVVREWVARFQIGDKDKTGAAAVALRNAADEIAKVESLQSELALIMEMPALDGRGILRVSSNVFGSIEEAKALPQGLDQARGGLARLVDGLRQIHGMLRQAKITGRVLDQIDAAINGLKMTRNGLDALVECGGMVGTKSVNAGWGKRYERAPAGSLKKGMWIQGGSDGEPLYRQVTEVSQDDGVPYVTLTLSEPYLGADGVKHYTARFHSDAMVPQAS